jgi:hypothetical protein
MEAPNEPVLPASDVISDTGLQEMKSFDLAHNGRFIRVTFVFVEAALQLFHLHNSLA